MRLELKISSSLVERDNYFSNKKIPWKDTQLEALEGSILIKDWFIWLYKQKKKKSGFTTTANNNWTEQSTLWSWSTGCLRESLDAGFGGLMTVVGGSGGELGSFVVWGGFFVFWGGSFGGFLFCFVVCNFFPIIELTIIWQTEQIYCFAFKKT